MSLIERYHARRCARGKHALIELDGAPYVTEWVSKWVLFTHTVGQCIHCCEIINMHMEG